MENAETLTFEAALLRLEEIVTQLDQGDPALEAALALFEEGSKLKEFCETKLSGAEATVEQLLQPAVEPEATNGPPGSLFGDDA